MPMLIERIKSLYLASFWRDDKHSAETFLEHPFTNWQETQRQEDNDVNKM